jgi:hypothetical protein
MDTQKSLGQFYTTNYRYILDGFDIPTNEKIIEPFVGSGELVKYIIESNCDCSIDVYDISINNFIDLFINNEQIKKPKKIHYEERDTLMNPPNYENSFIITNPPYLARNKSREKYIYDKYKLNDLYKCFIDNLVENQCSGGVIIVPLNFWCSNRKTDAHLRSKFLNIYSVLRLNIFEEKVFDDTTYTVCSFQFVRGVNGGAIPTHIYPSKKYIEINLNESNRFTICGDIYKTDLKSKYDISRLTRYTKDKHSNILLKCIDDNSKKKLGLSIIDNVDDYRDDTPYLSQRSFAVLVINPFVDINFQYILVDRFNTYVNKLRDEYNSLFLTNYRESKDIARKRISFELAYYICQRIIEEFSSSVNLITKYRINTNPPIVCVVPSSSQTKQWRQSSGWYSNGKKNECEKYQLNKIHMLLKHVKFGDIKISKTPDRINIIKKQIGESKSSNIDWFDWTENFDGKTHWGNATIYFNLKFVCGDGGAQTRTLREVYHFIRSQLDILLTHPPGQYIFINILDGDQSHKFMDKFEHLLTLIEYKDILKYIYIGDLHNLRYRLCEFKAKFDRNY